MNWKPPRKQSPRDEWGRFRSRAAAAQEAAADQQQARLESLMVARDELYWEAQQAD